MITVLGASGFIGSNIVKKLQRENVAFYAPKRNENLFDRALGDIIYCIGLTADFRTKPFDTVAAHICKLNEILSKGNFSSLTYLSSTRVYINSNNAFAEETDKVLVDPLDADDLYTLTKLTGERLCLSSGKNCKIVRLSNVIGKQDEQTTFLSSIINEIKNSATLELHQTLTSSKDYIFIDDIVELIIKIVKGGNQKIYNLASGDNISNQEIILELKKYFTFSHTINENAKEIIFPKISNNKICAEFEFEPKNISEQLSLILKNK